LGVKGLKHCENQATKEVPKNLKKYIIIRIAHLGKFEKRLDDTDSITNLKKSEKILHIQKKYLNNVPCFEKLVPPPPPPP